MNRLFGYLASVLVIGGLVVALLQCSSEQCGNGVKEGSEQCDDGAKNGTMGDGCSMTCTLMSIPRAAVEVDVQLLMLEAPGYVNASVNDLGIGFFHVVVSGPMGVDEQWMSTKQSAQYVGVPAGDYQATVTALDASMTPLTNPVSSMMGHVDIPGMVVLKVNFHQADFIKQDYKGTLYVSPNWGANNGTCAGASPPVAQESFELRTMAGAPVAGMTQIGQMPMNLHNLDGTYGTCFDKSQGNLQIFEYVSNLPWGHYQLILRGKDSGGTIAYCKKVDDIFVGPGIQNPTNEVIVPAADADMGPCP
jgi:cysteine-rich repeat protein